MTNQTQIQITRAEVIKLAKAHTKTRIVNRPSGFQLEGGSVGISGYYAALRSAELGLVERAENDGLNVTPQMWAAMK